MFFQRKNDSSFKDVMFIPLADTLAAAAGIMILLILANTMEPKSPRTFSDREQASSGAFRFKHASEYSYNGQITTPVLLYQDFFMVPAAEVAIGASRRYEYDKISDYPELKLAFEGYFGEDGSIPTYIHFEPNSGGYSIAVFLGNLQTNSVIVDKLDEGCQFIFEDENLTCEGGP